MALPRLPSPAQVVVERAFAQVDIEGGVALVEHPSESRFYLVVKSGQIYTFTPNDPSPELFVDIEDALMISGEAGLLDLEFHPDFAANGQVFLSYNAPGGAAMLSRVSRFSVTSDGSGVERDSEAVIIEVDQPYTNHNGGDIGFGPDGLLYFGLGDGGSAGDPQGNGQNTDTLLGAMLRIDVDGAEPYAIPPDNPFAAGGGAPEIYAWGFRNPWRWSFDRATGDLWLGDVGQHRWEEIDRVLLGGNYGWGVKEGPECIGVDTCAGDFIDPVAAYRNAGSASVVGGAVMRGNTVPAFEGGYIFSDFYDGMIWHVPLDAGVAGKAEMIGSDANGIAAWTLARDGTLYGTRYQGGLVRLVEGEQLAPVDEFPRKLSATGCVDVEQPANVLPWILPYDINLPFWSDGADKQRFVAVPDGETASVDNAGLVQWPRGTVLGKSFSIDERLVETRLLVRDGDGWVGYGYAWDADGRDATFVDEERSDAAGWIFPGLRGCPACHTDAAGGPLGTTVAQLDRQVLAGGTSVDQLRHLADLGVLASAGDFEPLPQPADPVSAEVAVRAYLHVNCSPCHRDEGTGGRADLDLRREIPLADSGLCDAPSAGDLGLTDPRIVVPAAPERSILLARINSDGDAHMPPLATAVRDAAAVELVQNWIAALADCPGA